jgi:hypothetical protein
MTQAFCHAEKCLCFMAGTLFLMDKAVRHMDKALCQMDQDLRHMDRRPCHMEEGHRLMAEAVRHMDESLRHMAKSLCQVAKRVRHMTESLVLMAKAKIQTALVQRQSENETAFPASLTAQHQRRRLWVNKEGRKAGKYFPFLVCGLPYSMILVGDEVTRLISSPGV